MASFSERTVVYFIEAYLFEIKWFWHAPCAGVSIFSDTHRAMALMPISANPCGQERRAAFMRWDSSPAPDDRRGFKTAVFI